MSKKKKIDREIVELMLNPKVRRIIDLLGKYEVALLKIESLPAGAGVNGQPYWGPHSRIAREALPPEVLKASKELETMSRKRGEEMLKALVDDPDIEDSVKTLAAETLESSGIPNYGRRD